MTSTRRSLSAFVIATVGFTVALPAAQRPAPDPASYAATTSSVTASTTSGKLLDANGRRRGAVIYNDSLAMLYLKFGPTCAGPAASAPSFTYEVPQYSHWEMPSPPYRGEVHGIWLAANGAARVTDLV